MNEDFSNQPQEPVVPEPTKPKSNRRLVLVLISTGVALLVAAATIITLFILNPKDVAAPTTDTQTSTSETSQATEEDYAKAIIENIRTAEQALVATHPTLTIEDSTPSAPPYMVANTDYNVTGSFGYSLTIQGASATLPTDKLVLDAEKAAIDTLRTETLPVVEATEYGTTYSSDNVVCHVSTNTYPTFITCANARDYQKVADEVAPFAAAFFTSSNEAASDPTQTVFYTPVITKKDTGYSNATVSIGSKYGVGGFAGLFYQKENEVWHYWTGTQSVIPCRDYDTEELQKAFVGDACYDLTTEEDSVVKVSS